MLLYVEVVQPYISLCDRLSSGELDDELNQSEAAEEMNRSRQDGSVQSLICGGAESSVIL